MCRFAIIETSQPHKPAALLERFSRMARKSTAPNGQVQGDGWGISWFDDKKGWQRYVSVRPVWDSQHQFAQFPATSHYLLHARNASFAEPEANPQLNQPYIDAPTLAFAFNGLLRGVRFPQPVVGTIGAQKIFTLLRDAFQSQKDETLTAPVQETVERMNKHSRSVQALNFAVSTGSSYCVYSQYSQDPQYYTLHEHTSPDMRVVSSEPLEGYEATPLPAGAVHTYERGVLEQR